jgi:hypothetical protein
MSKVEKAEKKKKTIASNKTVTGRCLLLARLRTSDPRVSY